MPRYSVRFRRSILTILLAVSVALSVLLAACASSTTGNPATPSSPPHTQVTRTSDAPTPQPVGQTGPAVIGGSLDAFKAQYGAPNSNSWPAGGAYSFGTWPGTNTDKVQINVKDGHVYTLAVNAPPSQPWTMQEAENTCKTFLPGDAHKMPLTRQVTDAAGLFMVETYWVSSTVANEYPSSVFIDVDGQPETPGTVQVRYTVNTPDTTHVLFCDLNLGSA